MKQEADTFLPVSRPQIGPTELHYVMEALQAGDISGTAGRFRERFEREFAAYCGCAHGIATSSGTAALHLAVAALGIGPGDEVLVSTLTNMATFFAVLYQGGVPIPVDIEKDTWNLDPTLLERLVTPRTKAILVVYLYGHPADMDSILDVAARHNLHVIEDAAEAHGATYKGRKVGGLGHVGCFSFYANKIITTGEGGMLTTNDPALAETARSLHSLAYGGPQRFMHEAIGFNYRMTNLQAALGCAQLEKIESVIAGKRRVAHFYNQRFASVDALQTPAEKEYARNVYWMYHVVLRPPLAQQRNWVRRRLADKGIETREAFVPYNLQEIFISRGWTRPADCPIANEVSRAGFYLPSSPNLTEEELNYVAEQVLQTIRESADSPSQRQKQTQ